VATLTGDRYPSIDFTEIFYRITQTNASMRKAYYPTMAGAYVNSSLEAVENELRVLHEKGVTNVVFIDDTFNYSIQMFKRLLRMMIANDFKFRWVSFLRCSNVDEEALDLMKESGCIGVLLGIESGDQRILQLMNKSAKVDRYHWGIAELNKRGIGGWPEGNEVEFAYAAARQALS
jgi:hypothetical protein